jgi:hypothetical protein
VNRSRPAAEPRAESWGARSYMLTASGADSLDDEQSLSILSTRI